MVRKIALEKCTILIIGKSTDSGKIGNPTSSFSSQASGPTVSTSPTDQSQPFQASAAHRETHGTHEKTTESNSHNSVETEPSVSSHTYNLRYFIF